MIVYVCRSIKAQSVCTCGLKSGLLLKGRARLVLRRQQRAGAAFPANIQKWSWDHLSYIHTQAHTAYTHTERERERERERESSCVQVCFRVVPLKASRTAWQATGTCFSSRSFSEGCCGRATAATGTARGKTTGGSWSGHATGTGKRGPLGSDAGLRRGLATGARTGAACGLATAALCAGEAGGLATGAFSSAYIRKYSGILFSFLLTFP